MLLISGMYINTVKLKRPATPQNRIRSVEQALGVLVGSEYTYTAPGLPKISYIGSTIGVLPRGCCEKLGGERKKR